MEPEGRPAPACHFHPDRPPVKECPNCRTPVCAECIVHLDLSVMCKRCWVPAGTPLPPEPKPEPFVAWENSAEGAFNRFWKTWAEIAGKPQDFFARLPAANGRGLWAALSFNYMWAAHTCALMLVCCVPIAGIFMVIAATAAAGSGGSQGAEVGAMLGGVGVAVIVGIPVAIALIIPIMLFVYAACSHVVGKMMGVAAPFETTWRIVGYSVAVSSVAQMIPYAGALAALAWLCVLLYFGAKKTLGLTENQSILYCLAPVIPTVMCCVSYFALAIAAETMK